MNSVVKPTIVSKETIQRLLRDVKHIMKNSLIENGIYYHHDDEDMLKGYAMIVGPSDTPYFGGYYFFEIYYPADYPHSPPVVKYCTNGDNIRFNPNLYMSGKVCISLLNTWRGEQWTSCQTISTLLLTLCTLLCKDPLLNEPGVTVTHKDFKKYTDIIEYKNIDIAILRMIQKRDDCFHESFHVFYPYMKEHFFRNNPAIIQYLENKMGQQQKIAERVTTGMYNMCVVLDYKTLYNQYLDTMDALKKETMERSRSSNSNNKT